MTHLILAPILIPLLFGALTLLLERRHSVALLRWVSWLGIALLTAASLALFARAAGSQIEVYLMGNWPSRLGIVLVLDRLSALMTLTTALLAAPCLLHVCAGWDRRALHFHPLFHLQLAGLNGAFLTGDLFNLFVFFEVMLIASYGLLLSGARGPRLRAGLHYVVFNIAASTLFLLALGLLYGILGNLNMAELAGRIATVPARDAPLLLAASGLLLVVFCAKAALLPLYAWLPHTYSRAPAAVAALFAIMTKVGLYSALRVGTLLFGAHAGVAAHFASGWLLPAGFATVILAALGVMGAARLRVAVSYLVMISAGTLFIAFALDSEAAIAAGLFYLPHSVFVAAALFLLADLILRVRGGTGEMLLEVAPIANRTLLSVLFLIGAVSVAGLPPLSGFIGKLALLMAVPADKVVWAWFAILFSSMLTIIGLSRIGTRLFWRVDAEPVDFQPPALRRQEISAVCWLLGLGLAMTVAAEPLLDYTQATAAQLFAPQQYIERVQATLPARREPSP